MHAPINEARMPRYSDTDPRRTRDCVMPREWALSDTSNGLALVGAFQMQCRLLASPRQLYIGRFDKVQLKRFNADTVLLP